MHPRNIAALAHDLLVACVAWCLAYWLRFNFDIPSYFLSAMLKLMVPAALVQVASCVVFGLYRGIWRYASANDLQRIILAVGVGSAGVAALVLLLEARIGVPRSVFFLDPILLVMMMGGSRFAYRAWKEQRLYGRSLLHGEPVAVIGAGEAGATLVHDLQRSGRLRVVALFDDSPRMIGRIIHGVRVVGAIAQLPAYAARTEVRRAIIALPSAAASARRRAVETAQQAGLAVMTVPALEEIVSGRVAISQVRNVELEDLLGRDQVELDAAGIGRWISGRPILVTGAGGSIGSALCRQIARHRPANLILLDSNEFALYRITEEFARRSEGTVVTAAIGDVKDEARIRSVFQKYRPGIVFHAAAYKHVPLMEEENAWQAVLNNALGTWVVAAAACEFGTDEFVLISTDKAVNPTNVMGATKRLAEMVCQSLMAGSQAAEGGDADGSAAAMAAEPLASAASAVAASTAADGIRSRPALPMAGHGRCKFVTVRFGNVLGSDGSVIPKFKEQIAAGGPLTVTHPDIERYFMLIPEAAQLVLQAGYMGNGGEIFVLDMGEPIKIADLARDMIRLSGFSEDEVKIVYTGLRPGEKLYEELLADEEHTAPTRHPKIRIATQREAGGERWREHVLAEMRETGQLADREARVWLARWVPEYHPQEPAQDRAAVHAA